MSVVLDSRNPAERLAQIAGMCDRVGIGAIWTDDLATLTMLAATVEHARLGAVAPAGVDPAELLVTGLGGRLEVTVRGASVAGLDALRAALDAPARPRLAVELPAGADPAPWLGVADDLVLVAGTVDELATAAVAAREAAAAAGRDPATLGVAARLPVSVGRTVAEALARWQAEPAFAALGPPQAAAVFGTLEQCHDRVIALAHAGVTDLRCVLPNTADVHDVIAQLTAMTVGTVDKLVPGAPRSPAPPPPPGWGGRPRFPTGSPSPQG